MDKRVVVDEETAPMVVDMFNKYLDVRSARETARYILQKYNLSIDLRSIKAMLQNKWYIGEAYGIPGWCPQIIDNDTFARACELVQIRADRCDTTRTDRVYLFTGLIFCEHCGRRLATYACRNKAGTEYIYYRCTGRSLRRCDMHRQYSQDKLEQWLLDNVRIEAELYNAELENRGKQSNRKTVDKTKIMAKIEKLKNPYINDLIPLNMYEADYRNLSNLLKSAEEDEKEANKKPFDLKLFDDFKNSYEKLDPEHRKAFWTRVVKSITVNAKDEIKLVLNTPT